MATRVIAAACPAAKLTGMDAGCDRGGLLSHLLGAHEIRAVVRVSLRWRRGWWLAGTTGW